MNNIATTHSAFTFLLQSIKINLEIVIQNLGAPQSALRLVETKFCSSLLPGLQESKDQQDCNLPQLSDSKCLVRRHTWQTTTPTGVHKCHKCPHRCLKLQVWKGCNFLCWSVLLCLQTDGSSFAEDSQSLCLQVMSLVLGHGHAGSPFRNWTLLKKETPGSSGFFIHELSSRIVSPFPQKWPLNSFPTHFTLVALPRSWCLAC